MQASPLEQQQLSVAVAPSFWHHVRFELVRRYVAEHGIGTVLDVGAGSGLLGDHLRSTGIDYRFAEASPRLRDSLARRFGADRLDTGGPITAETVVTVLDVIEHIDDDAAFLADLADRMRPGAHLVVTVPALPWLFSSWDRDLGHHRRYRRQELRSLVSRAGFDIGEATYLFPELIAPAVTRRWRRSDGTEAEFPALPGWADRTARAVSTGSARVRRIWPLGTSVLVTGIRRGATR